MSLSSFIAANREPILAAWEQDAMNRIPAEVRAEVAPLRDHLGDLLSAIASDLEAAGSSGSSLKGHRRMTWTHVEALATKHGADRAHQGITITQMVPEFPALRFCASQLWLASQHERTAEDLADLVRFDEAIDFALTRSVAEFMEWLNRSRETFLGVLGHDLRDPLSTIITGARLLQEEELDTAKTRDVAARISSTGERMLHLVEDLLDFTQTRLGRLPIERREADMASVVRGVTDEFVSSHRDRPVHVDVTGDMRGRWDTKRMSQVVSNLLGNAFHHGAAESPIDVSAKADEHEVTILVHNEGPAIPAEKQAHLFEPMSADKAGKAEARQSKHLGLGLYIANAIVTGHGGRIDVESTSERGTTFAVHLPRHLGADTAVDLGSR